MPIKQATPYLFFNGTAADAIELYQRAFGARPEGVMRYAELGSAEYRAEDRDKILHAALHLGDAMVMLSDVSGDQPPTPNEGNVSVTLDWDELAGMERAFAVLAEEGKVFAKIHDTFWGAKFGVVTDKFNINWMFNHTLPKQ